MTNTTNTNSFAFIDEVNEFDQNQFCTSISMEQEKEIFDTIMNIFIAVAVADQKTLDVEVLTCIRALKFFRPDDAALNFIHDFNFNEKTKEIKSILNGPGKKYWLGTQYMKLRDHPNHQTLLDELWKISVCDGRLDSREAHIIDFFAYFWKRNQNKSTLYN